MIGDRPASVPELPATFSLLAHKPQTALPVYLAQTDLALIPFVISPTTLGGMAADAADLVAFGPGRDPGQKLALPTGPSFV
ncbi:MAG: hypothetical protein ACT4OP_03360 [Actinomycetota bacterium]